ncbi:toprim domain-containing protein [Capnocytophaga genosp. AHN8471]|uniref:Toprim domain-containing protein n=1 Tax=Capnocytophaga genosp. AHN8471 TaxID=327574 RepID=A0ABS1YX16_9FLAO|nr:toprim domain-containing protein [Capnocytophaga genosp. AHN8471]MBM0650959.1 toprim domain-containing protein [Capnocytophaga genosp. AHN8471]MBM0661659.1 toprim domain-containing protein [Capnocytophaga genosp. AHN8471]
MAKQHFLSPQDIENIINNTSIVDYFHYLADKGRLKFDRQRGHDYYFLTENEKYSVSDTPRKGYYDFKAGEGGQIIKAVMKFEEKSWREAVDFLKDFSNTYIPETEKQGRQNAENKIPTPAQEVDFSPKNVLVRTFVPNNDKLLAYFAGRGISKEILQQYAQQVHYHNKTSGKDYFGIGIPNQSGGYDVKSLLDKPYDKAKVGVSDISIIPGTRNEAVVFEGMTDMFSYLQMAKDNGKPNDRTLVVLNSVTNTGTFIDRFKNYTGKIHLFLDGDKAGNDATQNILNSLKNSVDERGRYGIGKGEINDLNDFHLKVFNSLRNPNKSRTFASDNNIQIQTQNGSTTIEPNRVSSPKLVGEQPLEPNLREPLTTSQSQQERTHPSRQAVGSDNAGNGLSSSERSDLGGRTGRPEMGSNIGAQQEILPNQRPLSTEEHRSTGRDIPNGDRPRPQGDGEQLPKDSVRPTLLNKSNSTKVSNEEITTLVNSLTFVADDNTIQLNEGVQITDEIKNTISQYKSGGITKDNRGVLDEYYTDEKLVNAVRNLIKNNFSQKQSINILEPSVGTGNFLHATNNLGLKTNVSAFEINETTAKIAKLLHPQATINLRSFETEFITDNGTKKDFTPQYDLVIGNPPYGSHRGLYLGLGEETKLPRYEDYFVKRSLDVMNEGATLAMVLPSGWLNRQDKLSGAELSEAYRLPNGAFKATDVGTDIVILRKNSQAQTQNISNYFKEHPQQILGDTLQRKNRFGREEDYVKGNLDDALTRLQEFAIQKVVQPAPTQAKEQGIQLDMFSAFDSVPAKEPIAEKKERAEEDTNTQLLEEAKEKVDTALNILEGIKFKSLDVQIEIGAKHNVKRILNREGMKFEDEYLQDIIKKSNNIIEAHTPKPKKTEEKATDIEVTAKKTKSKKQSEESTGEYKVQSTPEISKKVLKYHFVKDDTVVDTALQNSHNITPEQVKAFADTDYMGRLFTDDENIRKKYGNLYKGMLIHDFYYTEGNIYEKLEQLVKDFAKQEMKNGEYDKAQFQKQKALLESVLPPKKQLEDIIISPNHEFVHNFDLGKEEKEVYNSYMRRYDMVKVDYNLADKFKDFVLKLPSKALEPSSSWEVIEFVDNQMVTGNDKERNALIRERRKEVANNLFQKFLREELPDDLKERFVNEFNRKYNNLHIPDYSQFPLFSKINQNFKGKPLELTEVQKAGIGRLTTKGVGLLAHEVGFGKTLSGVLSMHEAMQRGNAKRPLIVVPNDSILKQWVETIFEAIPNAKVNVLGNLGKDYDLSHFDNKDGEITLVTYEGFQNIGFSDEITQRLAEKFSYINKKDVDSLENPITGGVSDETMREIELAHAKEKKMQGIMKRGKVYDWEDFGFDHLTFDEVHNANHIVDKVRIEDKRFASDFRSQNQRPSKLGLNTWVASQYIQENYDGRNVTLLSATPFTNKPLEYYSVLSLIANQRLEKSGYFNVNNFFETFMEADNDMEIDAKGDVKFKTNVRRFKNNALFQQLLSEFIDIKGEEDNPQLVRPNRINKEYKIEQNEFTKKEYDTLNLLFDESEEGAILSHILNARLIAFSPYLSKNYEGDVDKVSTKDFIENSPKLKTTMDLIRQNKTDKPEAGQIIYSELAVQQFPRLKEYLVDQVGYKSDEVGIITGATNKNQRLSIQEQFNDGKIKVIIGSEAIQEGMNLQEKTSDMYLLTLPYNFTSLRQVEGRMWRQGNQWENVRVNYMLTNDSIDVFMLQKLQAKQSRYMEAIKKGANIIDVSDVDTQELKTAIITNPETRAEIEVELMKKRYENEKTKHAADLGFISRKFEDYTKVYNEYLKEKKSYEDIQKWAETDDYWKGKLPYRAQQVERAKKEIEQVIEKLAKKGVNIADFQHQQEIVENKIASIDKEINEELPIIRERLITQYKQEKQERLNAPQIDFIQERAEENKTFFKLRPTAEKSENKVAENKTSQDEEQRTYKAFKR